MATSPPTRTEKPLHHATGERPTMDGEDQSCSGCGSPLSPDQRYCLHCGRRRSGAGLPSRESLSGRSRGERAAQSSTGRDWTPLVALGGLGALAIVLVVGVLIGKSTGSSSKQAAAPQVIRVGGGGSGSGNQNASQETFKSDWPSGQTAYTVELGTLSKDGSTPADVASAKKDATSKGASDVGALDSDDFGSLPGGKYVVYSGRYGRKAAAQKALAKLKRNFPDARLIHVSDKGSGATGGGSGSDEPIKARQQDLQNLDNSSGDDYVKKSRKLPDSLALPGKAPSKDNVAPGGGSSGTEIK